MASSSVPKNPWLPNNGTGISLVFNQSYHSVYHCDSYRAEHFQDWLTNGNRYQVPNMKQEGVHLPLLSIRWHAAEADLVPHIVEKCTNVALSGRHRQLMYNRFGFTSDLRIGNQFHDAGLPGHVQVQIPSVCRPDVEATSNGGGGSSVHLQLHVLRAHAHHHRTRKLQPRYAGRVGTAIVRNLYRLYVDTYECMGSNTDDDSVPCVMGFSPAPINKREDRGVVLYAGSLACLNSKLATSCSSPMNRGERVCSIYKQVYLNDATLLYTRLLRQERRKILHDNNFNRARLKRGRGYGRSD